MGKELEMNKKGMSSMINIPFGLVGFFILILVLVSLLPTQYDSNLRNEENVTKIIETLDKTQQSSLENFKINESDNPIIKVTYSFCGFIIYSAIEVAEVAVVWGSDNVNIVNPSILLKLIIICLLAPIIIILFKLTIIIFILVKEYIQSRKEKKELKRYKKNG